MQVPQLLDTQTGRIFAIKTTKVATETVLTKGQNVQADKFEMRGDLNIDLWYTGQGEWVKLFDLNGRLVKEWTKEEIDIDRIEWDGRIDGECIASGLYFLVIESEKGRIELKVVNVK